MTFAGRQTPTLPASPVPPHLRPARCTSRRLPSRAAQVLAGAWLAAMLSGCVGSFQPLQPPAAPSRAAITPITGQSLIHHCHAALPRAHPWRARQLKSALIRYQLSRAYYPTAPRMSQRELDLAARQEREAWSLLWETCQPLLADAR